MKRTLIYVFGPKRLSSQYFSNTELKQHDGGWLKIGQTSETDDCKDMWDCAMERINQEVRTGIPEVCQLFDVFEYPEMSGNVDDRIRNLLTNDMYCLECSKLHNQSVEKYEIKAGREFVYGVTRSQVLNAVAKFERDLILDYYGKEGFDDFMELIKHNNSGELPFEPVTEGESTDAPATSNEAPDTNVAWCDNLWANVIERVKDKVQSHINNPKGRPYIGFNSPIHEGFAYDCGYSVRYNTTRVCFYTTGGGDAKAKMQEFIAKNDVLSQLPDLEQRPGARQTDKWMWLVTDTLEKTEDELVDWFAENILKLYNTFEK